MAERQRIAGSEGTVRALRLVELLAGRASGASVTELAEELAENRRTFTGPSRRSS